MEKLTFVDIENQQLVDIRSQQEYQEGHIARSINLIPKNFKKYAPAFLSTGLPLIFIIGEESKEEVEKLQQEAFDLGFTQVEGYIQMEDVSKENLQQTETIAAKDFLKQVDNYILLDVRHPDEITRPAPEKNLVNLPLEELPENLHSLNGQKEIYTLCGSGNRGTAAASYLVERGFKPTVIEGGMKAIQEVQKNN